MRVPVVLFVLLIAACHREPLMNDARQGTPGEPERGRAAIERYGCGACHSVPGVSGAKGMVGPSLKGIGSRTTLAGQLPNTPENMIRWIREPQSIDKATSMPNMNVGEGDARDIAAYLYTLRQ